MNKRKARKRDRGTNKKKLRKKLRKLRLRIEERLRVRQWPEQPTPMFAVGNIHYDLADRIRGLDCGGIGAIQLLVRQIGLDQVIDRELHLLKRHLPYHESDHVLNIAYNILTGGTCLEDIELRRNDEVYLDALGTQRIPDPTTAGDFCRRFSETDVEALMEAINQSRLEVWSQQASEFFEEAVIDADGTIAQTYGECKKGMALAYNGEWGFHPLLVSLANTAEPLYLVNRSGNRPSHEDAWYYLERAAELCECAGFRRIVFRGDTDFSQTVHLDGWQERGYEFVFGMDAMPNLVEIAENLGESAWQALARRAKYSVKTKSRRRPFNVKEEIVVENGYKNIKLESEQVAEFEYRPTKCKQTYRMVVIRKNLSVYSGEEMLFPDIRYFFYITNITRMSASELVFFANGRCNQENLIDQLKNGIHALRMPVDNLVSNWAYMVIASLAWNLKAWFGLSLPESGRWAGKHKREKSAILSMEFKKFLNAFIRIPCQLVHKGRRLVFKLLSWNPWLEVLFRGVEAWRHPLRC